MPGNHVLIVDDFKDNREMYEYFLSEKGFRVSLAANGQEAVDKTFELRPDLVVMDLSLPVMSGIEATRRIKADERTRHIPVVILSGHEISGLADEVGCEGVLVKPCLPTILIAEISRILKNGARARSANGGVAV